MDILRCCIHPIRLWRWRAATYHRSGGRGRPSPGLERSKKSRIVQRLFSKIRVQILDLQYILLSSGSNHSFNSIPPLAPWDLPSLIPLPFPNPLPLLLPFRWFPLSHGHTYYQPSEHAATAIFGKATVESYPKEILEPRKNSLGFFILSMPQKCRKNFDVMFSYGVFASFGWGLARIRPGMRRSQRKEEERGANLLNPPG